MCGMYNSLFLLFLILFDLILISICLIVYLFKTVFQGIKKILENEIAMEKMKEKQEV